MPVVSNTSPISNLAVIGKLDLLRTQFEKVLIPKAVERELLALSHPQAKSTIETALKEGWLEVRTAGSPALIALLKASLHEGESEAIALAVETSAPCTLLDEREARASALRMNLTITGVLGVLLRAKKRGDIPAVKPLMEQLRHEAHFYIAADLERQLLEFAGE
jgi:predicted nucleic acid-binding protein